MKALKHLNKYFYQYRYKLLWGVLITIVARVFALFAPNLVGQSVTLIEQHLTETPIADLRKQLFINILLIIGTSLLAGGFTFLMRQFIINVSRYIEFDLKNEIYQHYQKLSQRFYKQNRTGDLMNRISEDVGKVRMYVGPALMYSINTITLFVVVIGYMLSVAPTLTAYTLLPLPILSITIYKLSRAIHHRSTVVQEYLSKLSTFTQESFSGITVAKAYTLEPQLNHQMEVLSEGSKEKKMDLVKVQAWFFPLMILLIGISNILMIFIGGKQYISGQIELGVLAEFIIYVNMLTWPVATVGWVTSIVQQAEASQKRINEFLKEKPEIQNTTSEKRNIKGKVTFSGVGLTYDNTGIEALKDLTFEVEEGETIAVMGKTGAGKTTLLELLSRMYDPSEGQIEIDDHPINDYRLQDLRSAIGFVPQHAFLFSDTIENNIKFGRQDSTEQEMISVAELASVHKNIIQFKDQYKTMLGERGITLSGGQKQRVSIARALLTNPKILLLDDALSAVDTETEELILENLKKATDGMTTFIVCHRVSSAKNADRIIVLEDGKLKEMGTHKFLLKQDGYYASLYEKQLTSDTAQHVND